MGPTTEYTIGSSSSENDGQPSSVEDFKSFQYSRNMTGVVGDSKWHSDIKVNELWDKFSVPEKNGKRRNGIAWLIGGVFNQFIVLIIAIIH